ncbi:hypothetical protein LGR54_18480 [Ancylobacter sp. Lp-2]|uniref:MFS transporter n=1 Tax=Ancylobacter sp. Lp-2 TaxID=2881339 RepID=UPI001E53C05C|nr:hypothetical protein [Ancylobacter sp. Lp-2]
MRPLRRAPGEARLAVGFALVVLAQALTIGVLPLAGAMLAPDPRLAALPLAALLLGAAAASVPASFLLDAFGRRAGFALGAGLGVAGGLIGAHGLYTASFRELVIGCAWLGAAQGFGMFYRHAAAFGAGAGGRSAAVGKLMGAGVLAGLIGPALAGWAEGLFTPFAFVGTLLAAALAQLGVLLFAVLLPEARVSHAVDPVEAVRRPVAGWRAWGPPTLIAALAWAAMSAAMSGVPLGLVACGVAGPAVTGFVAWHVVAMYAPALAGGVLAERFGAFRVAVAGLALAVAGLAATRLTGDVGGLALAFLGVGAGWSLATFGTTLALHAQGPSSRARLALHDGAILLAALAGVLLGAM